MSTDPEGEDEMGEKTIMLKGVMHGIVPAMKSPTGDPNAPDTNSYDDRKLVVRVVVTQAHKPSYSSDPYASIDIVKLAENGNLVQVVPEVQRQSRTYLGTESWVASNTEYFHIIACFLLGNVKRLTEAQYKKTRMELI